MNNMSEEEEQFFADLNSRTEMRHLNKMVLFYNQTLEIDDSIDLFHLRYKQFKKIYILQTFEL